uniref:Uncharacterized protein n=1 Tax=Zea mays TaxID=4577 RepID=A0A804QZB0_MAIZE
PLEAAPAGEVAPCSEQRQDDQLLQRVGGDEPDVHGVGVVGGDEVEGQQRHGEERHEAVDPRALVRREDAPPPDGSVRQDHGNVQRHHGRHDVVEVRAGDHLADRRTKKHLRAAPRRPCSRERTLWRGAPRRRGAVGECDEWGGGAVEW